jgi:hypothetical protein
VELDYGDEPEEVKKVPSRWSRPPRGNDGSDTPQNRTRAEWFQRGYPILPDDPTLHAENMGMDARERQALSEENTRPFGQDWNAIRAIRQRFKDFGRPEHERWSRLSSLQRILRGGWDDD